MSTDDKIIRGQVVEEETVITFDELCRHCMLEKEEIIGMVNEGILDPRGATPEIADTGHWAFHITSVRRVQTVVSLQRDLGVNLPGAALALDLLDQIEQLKSRS